MIVDINAGSFHSSHCGLTEEATEQKVKVYNANPVCLMVSSSFPLTSQVSELMILVLIFETVYSTDRISEFAQRNSYRSC